MGFRGSIYTTIMELGIKNHNGDGLLGSNSIMAVYMDPLGQLNTKQPSSQNPTQPFGTLTKSHNTDNTL